MRRRHSCERDLANDCRRDCLKLSPKYNPLDRSFPAFANPDLAAFLEELALRTVLTTFDEGPDPFKYRLRVIAEIAHRGLGRARLVLMRLCGREK